MNLNITKSLNSESKSGYGSNCKILEIKRSQHIGILALMKVEIWVSFYSSSVLHASLILHNH